MRRLWNRGELDRRLLLWLADDSRRNLVAATVAVVPALGVFLVVSERDDRWANTLLYVMTYWSLWCALHISLTYLAFGRSSAQRFRATIERSRPKRRSWWQRLLGEDDGAVTVETEISIMMVVVTLAIFLTPQLRADTAIVTLAAITTVASWLLNAYAYAVEYARTDGQRAGLEFPGDEEPGFSDFLYHAVCVNATFATSDVTVTSREMRRLTTTHTLIAFLFNTVIFGMLITLLTTV